MTLKPIILLCIVLSCIATGAAAAQQTTATPANGTATTAASGDEATTSTPTPGEANESAPPGAPGQVELVVDESTVLVSHQKRGGNLVLRFWSSEYKTVKIAPAADQDGSTGTVEFQVDVLDADKVTVVRVPDTGGVTMWTEASIEQNRFHYVKTDGGSLISGPYSGSDVQTAGLFGAIGVSIAVLYQALAAKLGASAPARRVA